MLTADGLSLTTTVSGGLDDGTVSGNKLASSEGHEESLEKHDERFDIKDLTGRRVD